MGAARPAAPGHIPQLLQQLLLVTGQVAVTLPSELDTLDSVARNGENKSPFVAKSLSVGKRAARRLQTRSRPPGSLLLSLTSCPRGR